MDIYIKPQIQKIKEKYFHMKHQKGDDDKSDDEKKEENEVEEEEVIERGLFRYK
jgi:hypothetical protein